MVLLNQTITSEDQKPAKIREIKIKPKKKSFQKVSKPNTLLELSSPLTIQLGKLHGVGEVFGLCIDGTMRIATVINQNTLMTVVRLEDGTRIYTKTYRGDISKGKTIDAIV